jgi:hypothetical protein
MPKCHWDISAFASKDLKLPGRPASATAHSVPSWLQIDVKEVEGGFHPSANPDAFPRSTFWRCLGVFGVEFEFDDLHDSLDG